MSSELKAILGSVAAENDANKRALFYEGLSRYKTLLIKVAAEKKLDILISVEGIGQSSKEADDLKVLENAHLVSGMTKYTHRNSYIEYTLTPKGTDLAEKLSKET